MLVCICNGITDKDIENEIYEGASSFKQVSKSLGVANCCGQCATYAKDLVDSTFTQLQLSQVSSLITEVKC